MFQNSEDGGGPMFEDAPSSQWEIPLHFCGACLLACIKSPGMYSMHKNTGLGLLFGLIQ